MFPGGSGRSRFELAAWGVIVPEKFPLAGCSCPLVMQRAVNLLAALGATEEDGSLTDTGKG